MEATVLIHGPVEFVDMAYALEQRLPGFHKKAVWERLVYSGSGCLDLLLLTLPSTIHEHIVATDYIRAVKSQNSPDARMYIVELADRYSLEKSPSGMDKDRMRTELAVQGIEFKRSEDISLKVKTYSNPGGILGEGDL